MKTIYLYDENWNKQQFQYNEISELKSELEKRGIKIGDNSKIGNNSKIGYNSTIGNNSTIGDNSKIGNNSKIGYNSTIGNNSTIGDNSKIGNNSTIGDNSKIGDNIDLQKNFYIVGSKHCVTYTGNNTLSIGCHNYTIEKWLDKFEIVGKKEGYSDAEISEYKQYILMAEQFAKL